MFAFGLKNRRALVAFGQLAHIELFLLGEGALMKLNNQDKPNQS
jgi:hypothetical protein